MSGLIDAATALMRASSRRVDLAALNVANVSTPGFKRQALASNTGDATFDTVLSRRKSDLRAGKLSQTGNPLDLAISGNGFFQLRAGDRLLYSRQGSFSLDADGRLVTPQGYAVQQAGGGDLVLGSPSVTITTDGVVLDGSRVLGRIAVVRARGDQVSAIDGSHFSIADDQAQAMEEPSLRQGMLESSSVSLGDEMIGMMGALRSADTGARLVQVYDDLMGKAISAFGQSAR